MILDISVHRRWYRFWLSSTLTKELFSNFTDANRLLLLNFYETCVLIYRNCSLLFLRKLNVLQVKVLNICLLALHHQMFWARNFTRGVQSIKLWLCFESRLAHSDLFLIFRRVLTNLDQRAWCRFQMSILWGYHCSSLTLSIILGGARPDGWANGGWFWGQGRFLLEKCLPWYQLGLPTCKFSCSYSVF